MRKHACEQSHIRHLRPESFPQPIIPDIISSGENVVDADRFKIKIQSHPLTWKKGIIRINLLMLILIPGMAVLLSACQSNDKPTKSPTSRPVDVGKYELPVRQDNAPARTKHAIALTGCVIVDQDGRMMQYRKKCESCGETQPGTTSCAIPGKYSKKTSSFRCYKCKNRQKVVIQGS